MVNNVAIRDNERSWAIQIITHLNNIIENNNLTIKRAGGETTISFGKKRMFPDIMLYGNDDLTFILQGWEIKMPDVPITDETFIKDAERKARALKLSSFVIWNFTYARFYILNTKNDTFEITQQWENLDIQNRSDVSFYKEQWISTLEEVFLSINSYFQTNQIYKPTISDIVSDLAIHLLINNYKASAAKYYKECCIENSTIEAEIDEWWSTVSIEFKFDEKDKYMAYAKTVILNWAYRIIFAHLIKTRQNQAYLIDSLSFDMTPADANLVFQKITAACDFYNVFEGIAWNELIVTDAWNALIELSLFLKENGILTINQEMLQYILEKSVTTSRREINGQYSTPKTLARLLAKLTIQDWNCDVIDPCCGTGTIPNAILNIKKQKIGISKAVASTWASDKYKLPLQIANISMTSADTINMANRLFQCNAFELSPEMTVSITNPENGDLMSIKVPQFGAICTNLPFVANDKISGDDISYCKSIGQNYKLDGRSDLCYYIALNLHRLIKAGGFLGIITSNAWLGTTVGNAFFIALQNLFHIKQVHISGKGRWFKNADIVTTLLILQKKETTDPDFPTRFFIWKNSLEDIENNSRLEQSLINKALLNRHSPCFNSIEYNKDEIDDISSLNVCYNALFHNIKWLLDIRGKLIPFQSLFAVIRGSRRGWDKLFFPAGNHEIESKFIKSALFNAKKVNSLIAVPDREAFSCSEDWDTISSCYPGAYKWISKFENQKNEKGKLLPQVLARSDQYWYEMQTNEVVELFTMMNPDKRIFFGRFEKPAFINQRLIGLKLLNPDEDVILYHALLNCILTKFYVEAVGFGRGLGVLDINKKAISKCFLLNPLLLSESDKIAIKNAFKRVCDLKIHSVEDELYNPEWVSFNKVVLKAFGIEEYYSQIENSLVSLRQSRYAAMEEKSPYQAAGENTIVKKYKSGIEPIQRVASDWQPSYGSID